MSKQHFPAGWDEARVKRLIDHYESMTDEEIIAEDEGARKAGKNHLPVTAGVAKINGKIKGSRHQKKGIQPKTLPRSKPRKAKGARANSASKG
jgi:hypothetical protein